MTSPAPPKSRRSLFVGTFTVLAAVGAFALAAGTAAGQDNGPDVCPEFDSTKIDTPNPDPTQVTMTAPPGNVITDYCIKGGSEQSGGGTAFINVNPPQNSITVGHPTNPTVSHYSFNWEPQQSTTTEPDVTTTEPDVTTTEPDVTTTEPDVTTTEPDVTTTEPDVTTTEPDVTTTEPDVTTTEPDVTTTEPDVTTTEPDVTTTEAVDPTTSQPEESTTTAVMVSPTTAATVDSRALPVTGSGTTTTGLLAGALLALGAGLVFATRRQLS